MASHNVLGNIYHIVNYEPLGHFVLFADYTNHSDRVDYQVAACMCIILFHPLVQHGSTTVGCFT